MRQRGSLVVSALVVLLTAGITFAAGVFSGGTLTFLAFLCMIGGIGTAYTAFGTPRSGLLFGGGTLFMAGFLLFLYSAFLFETIESVVYPAATLVTGLNLLLLFINEPRKRAYLYGGIALLTASALLLHLSGRLNVLVFTTAVWEVLAGSWKFILAAVIIPILLYAASRNAGR